jgi:NAD(P)-dependent dehydrogenase (short-subunit alcohol dehydrogenase family)
MSRNSDINNGSELNKQNTHIERLTKKYPKRRAFITGAGSGLGLAFAVELADAGWTIALTDVSPERLRNGIESVRTRGGSPEPYEFDVSDYEKFSQAVHDFERKHGGIDIGINNAGIGCGGFLHEMAIEDFGKVMNINLMGVVNGCHLFVPIMKRQKHGHILNVASAAAFVAAPRMSAYNTAKAGVLALSETLRAELDDEGIGVTVLMPTYVRTNIGNDSLGSTEDNKLARLFVEDSKLSADFVARETLQRISNNDLYVVMPKDAIFLWRFKRQLPDVFWRFISREAKRRSELLLRRSERGNSPR